MTLEMPFSCMHPNNVCFQVVERKQLIITILARLVFDTGSADLAPPPGSKEERPDGDC